MFKLRGMGTRAAGGFTMIELIVVIVLMAILAVTAMPRFFESGSFEGPAFAEELASAARYAQKLAVTSGCPVRFSVPDATHYELRQPQAAPSHVSGCDTTFTRPVMNPGTGDAFAATAPANVTLGGAPLTVEFRANGVPYPAGGVAPLSSNVVVTVGGKLVTITARSGLVQVAAP